MADTNLPDLVDAVRSGRAECVLISPRRLDGRQFRERGAFKNGARTSVHMRSHGLPEFIWNIQTFRNVGQRDYPMRTKVRAPYGKGGAER